MQSFEVLLEQNRLGTLDPEVVETLQDCRGLSHFRAGRSTGEPEAAREELRSLAELGFDEVPVDLTMTLCALLSARLGEQEHGQRIAALLEPFAELASCLGGVYSVSVSHYLGLLDAAAGDRGGASRRFQAAVALHERAGDRRCASAASGSWRWLRTRT